MQSIIMLSVFQLNVYQINGILKNVFLMNVVFPHFAECLLFESHSPDCQMLECLFNAILMNFIMVSLSDEWHSSKCLDAESCLAPFGLFVESHSAQCHFVEFICTDCHFVSCHSDECHIVLNIFCSILLNVILPNIIVLNTS